MTTITIWLLISLPGISGTSSSVPTTLVERFATVTECERVRGVIQGSSIRQPMLCVQATVVKGQP